MRLIITSERTETLVLAEPFEIAGSGEQFAAHRTHDEADATWRGAWSATHVETGFRIGFGNTIEEAIEHARENWASRTPEEIEHALEQARQIRKARELMRRGVSQ